MNLTEPTGIEQWLPKWHQNNFRTSSGEPVKNQPLILYLSELLSAKPPKTFRFEKVKAHIGIYGNEGADQLAVMGCMYPWREEYPDEWDLSRVPTLDEDILEILSGPSAPAQDPTTSDLSMVRDTSVPKFTTI